MNPMPLPGFADVVGHEREIAFFAAAADAGRFGHAYLLHGPDGVGKAHLALRVAAALACGTAPFGRCPRCDGCRRAISSGHPDVLVLAPRAGHARHLMEDVREFERQAHLSPGSAPVRALVLLRADLLAPDAADAFLKTLEEPPAATRFLLTAARPAAVLPTIRSRCQAVGLGPADPEAVAAWLASRGADPARARLAAALSGGAPGLASRILDDPRILEAREQAIRGFLEGEFPEGEPFPECLCDLASKDRAAERDEDAGVAKGERLREGLRLRLRALLAFLRDALVEAAAPGAGLAAAVDRSEAVARSAAGHGRERLGEMLEAVSQALSEVNRNLNVRLVLDVLGDRLRDAGWAPRPLARADR